MATLRVLIALIVVGLLLISGAALLPPETAALWGARFGVVAGAVEDRIDALLGKEAVLRQQALDAIQAAEDDIERLEELAVTSRVDARLLGEKLNGLQTVAAQAQKQLGQLAAMVDAGQPITLNGQTWQPADLKAYAQSKITEYTAIQERLRVLEESRRIQSETAERAEASLRLARQNVANMRASLDLLEAKFALLRLLRTQPDAMPGQRDNVNVVLTDAETLVQNLLGEVEREIQIAGERSQLHAQAAAGLSEPLPQIDDEELVNRLYDLSGVERLPAGEANTQSVQ